MMPQSYSNVVMVTLDCVRPDFLGCYGNQRVHTPNIDRIAAHGTVFEEAISQAPCTWVSHAGIFTGTYPPVHDLRTPFDTLSQRVSTLAEILSDSGFATAGFPANDLVGSRTGLHRGFNFYYENYSGESASALSANRKNPWPQVMEAAEEWIKARETRFFSWFHYMDTHHLQECDYLPEYYRTNFNRDWQFYEGKISYADDECVGRILSLLDRYGFRDNTLLVIFADHGEELNEDGHPRHNGGLSDSVLRVPLIFSCTRERGLPGRVSMQARTVDIMPTVLQLLGIFPKMEVKMDGKSLFENQSQNMLFEEGCFLAYAENLPADLAAIRSKEWKFVKGCSGDSLFHLPSDPKETRNVLDKNPLTGKFYEEKLKKTGQRPSGFFHPMPAGAQDNSTANAEQQEETVRLLMSLGYM